MTKPKLYHYAISSCSFRVRIAFNVKNIEYEAVVVQPGSRAAEYAKVNPQGLVPFLQAGSKGVAQSLCIIEFAEETLPGKKLLPSDSEGRARARGIASYIVSEIQPLQNTRLDEYLHSLKIDLSEWKKHWVLDGLQHLESMLDCPETGIYCHGDTITVADCCLVPQVYNAVERFKLPLEDFPIIQRIYMTCCELPAVQEAWPDKQPDFAAKT